MAASRLTVVCLSPLSGRCTVVLESALAGRPVRRLPFSGTFPEGGLRGERLLFAVSLNEGGVSHALCDLLAFLRTHPRCLSGCVGGILVDGPGDLYTKAAGQELALAASLAGCAFVSRPLVEGTGSLRNFTVQARNAGCSLDEAYRLAVSDLADRVLSFLPPRRKQPKLLVLHASSRATSNTLALWGLVRQHLEERCAIREIGLRNGTLEDCAGCAYTTCLHYGEQGGCFYGGVMVQEVYPAILEADAVVLLCPNYNDALSANLTAAINRLTALYRAASFAEKAVFSIVVSGYSGGDLVARQAAGAMSMNKGFWLPANFCLLGTANDKGEALALPGVRSRAEQFAGNILEQLM